MIYIFDLDGTLADIEHRRKFLDKNLFTNLSPNERWRNFFREEEILKDTPKYRIMELLQILKQYHTIWIWSARPDYLLEVTLKWFSLYLQEEILLWPASYPSTISLRMRPSNSQISDVDLKRSWLEQLDSQLLSKINVIFDDRDSVVQMWRSKGLTCCQVAEGDF